MVICQQCNGNGNCVGTESTDDNKDNEESFFSPAPLTGNIVCTQCQGKGYY